MRKLRPAEIKFLEAIPCDCSKEFTTVCDYTVLVPVVRKEPTVRVHEMDLVLSAVAVDVDGMLQQGRTLAAIAPNVVVKLPLTLAGLQACKTFSGEGILTNVTLCFSANQALLAAKAGATYISPFIGRLDDIHIDGLELIREIRTIYDNYMFETMILAASIRSPLHVKDCALTGADVITAPPAVIRGLASHVLTTNGLSTFLADAKSAGITI